MELDWELYCLMGLETDVFTILKDQGVPTDLWQYYMAFAKRIWERAVDFDYATFQLEKTSLLNEFTLRGLDLDTLRKAQFEAEKWADTKGGRMRPPAWTYDNVIGSIWMYETGAYDEGHHGTGHIWDMEGSNGGYYDNR